MRINKDSKVVISLEEMGTTLVSKGNYSVADIDVKNGLTENEIFKLIKPSQTLKEPVFKQATKSITLGYEFLEKAFDRPVKPHRRASQKEWNTFTQWNKMSMKEKLAISIIKLAQAYQCNLIDFEILE